MNEKEAMAFIEKAGTYGSVLGLESTRELLCRLDNPQKKLKFIHIAGTNGKGSTLCFLSAALQQNGYKVGRYISPVLSQYRERIQVNERSISVSAMCRGFEKIKEAAEDMAEQGLPHPTAFEIETALAMLYFQEKACDIVVLETGLGGKLDATNIIENTVAAVFTPISMDHMAVLGNTLEEIAWQKAGIIKKGCYVVSAKQNEAAERVLMQQCEKNGVPFAIADQKDAKGVHYGIRKQWFRYGSFGRVEITMAGKYQVENCVLALKTLEVLGQLGFPVDREKTLWGIRNAFWPGRFQMIAHNPVFIVDGAHNEEGAKKLAASIEFYFTNKRIVYIMGILKDKEYDKIIRETSHFADQIITIAAPGNERALPAYELAQAVKQYHPAVTAADSLAEAVEMSYLLAEKETVIIAFGSLSFLGELMEIVKNRENLRSDTHGKSRED